LLKADFHIHTCYSMDTETSLEAIIDRCLKTGINCISVSDHGNIDGALEMQSLAPFKVIVSEEILTHDGEIIGMFLKENIPSHISVEEALTRIKDQDGLACLPHPYDPLRGFKADNNRLDELAGQIDMVEVFNARCLSNGPSDKARDFALKHGLPGTAGSDAHTTREIGRTYVEMPEFNDAKDFLPALREGIISAHPSSWLVHFHTTISKLKKLF